eukprot:superscaffoldBa00003248_g16470
MEHVADLPSGPLDIYRQKASFNWKEMLCFIDGEETLAFKEFVINSPDFEAAKFWVGNLGKTATHALVFAQLYTPDQVCHGLHSFLVP